MNKKILAAAALQLALLCACTPIHMEENLPSYTVGVVLKAMNSQHWLEIRSGMEQAAVDRDAELLLLYPENEQAVAEQDELIQSLLDREVDALLVAPCDSYHTAWFGEQAQDRSILCISVDTKAYDCDLPYVGADNTDIGRIAADCIAENLQEQDFVGVISGPTRQSSHIDRFAGFQARLDAVCPDVKIEVGHTDSRFAQGLEQAEAFLHRADCGALFCTNAVTGLAAAQAQNQMGTDAWIVAVDTQDDALYAVQDGTIDALVTQSGYEIGYQAICVAVDALEDGTRPEDLLLPSQLLTQDTIDAFMEQYRTKE